MRLATEVKALAALRLGDVALLASAPLGVLSAVFTKLPQDVIADVAMARAASQDERQVAETLSAVMLPLDWSDPMVEAVRQQRRVWLVGLEIAVLPPGIAMFWAAFRGGRWLDRARRNGSVSAAG